MDLFKQLNEIYKPLCDEAKEIRVKLKEAGIETLFGFYNNHSVKVKDGFVTEYFPIPVISIKDTADIIIHLDFIEVEYVVPKEKALNIKYDKLIRQYSFELYGMENFTDDLYNKDMDMKDVTRRIAESNETHICVCFFLKKEIALGQLLGIIEEMNTVLKGR